MAHVFFNTFFNLDKYLEYEQRDPFALARVSSLGDFPYYIIKRHLVVVVVVVVDINRVLSTPQSFCPVFLKQLQFCVLLMFLI